MLNLQPPQNALICTTEQNYLKKTHLQTAKVFFVPTDSSLLFLFTQKICKYETITAANH